MSKKIRNSNIELLRIVAMLSIIALHAFRHAAGDSLLMDGFSINHLVLQVVCSWGIVGTDIFIILSAFFLLESEKIDLQKVVRIIVMVMFYSVLVYTVSEVYMGGGNYHLVQL